MKKSFSIQEFLHSKSKRHGTKLMHLSSRAFQSGQEHNLKGSHNYKTKQNKLPSFTDRCAQGEMQIWCAKSILIPKQISCRSKKISFWFRRRKPTLRAKAKCPLSTRSSIHLPRLMRNVLVFPVTRQTKQNFCRKPRLMDSLREHLIYSELFSLA